MTAAAPVNGSNVRGLPTADSFPNPSSSAGRPQLKMSSSTKPADGVRKQAASPVDSSQRKPPQNAWAPGANPITQRSSNMNNSNGVANKPKPAQSPALLRADSSPPIEELRNRMMVLLLKSQGLVCKFTLKNGEKYTGVLSGTSLDPTEMRYVFKMVRRVQAAGAGSVNGASDVSGDYVGHGDSHVMSFDIADVVDFIAPNVVFDMGQGKAQNGISSAFRTDADISGNGAIRERNLQRWEPSADVDVNLSLELTGSSTEWDQFATNEQRFGVKSDYDENIYTTAIDRSKPDYAHRAAYAEKIAREIESGITTNSHVREERGQVPVDDGGGDEEDKYSGVRREYSPLPAGGANKYTPPARRPPTGLPTVPGAPVDPAIISSQLARPDSAAARAAQQNIQQEKVAPSEPKSEAVSKSEAPVSPKFEATTDAPKAEATAAPATRPAAEPAQRPSADAKPAVPGIPARGSVRPDNATANVEHEVLSKFKQFHADEKLRVSERQRAVARESKAVKLNDLKKFSQNFKLRTPVPTDLVPILAKDETKQQEIVQKALRAVQEKQSSAQSTPSTASVKTASATSSTVSTVKPAPTQPSPGASINHQQNQRSRPGQSHYGSGSMRGGVGPNSSLNQAPRGTGLLSTRLTLNQQQHKQGALPYNSIPHPIPMQDKMHDFRPPTGPSAPSSGNQTPTSAISKGFNVRAQEFRPNPAAHSFPPGGNPSTNSSPRPESAPKQQPRTRPPVTSFFNGSRPTVEPLDLDQEFNPIFLLKKETADELARLKKEVEEGGSDDSVLKLENKTREYTNNGGLPSAFRTPPTWDFPSVNTDDGYKKIFEKGAVAPRVTGPHNLIGGSPMPHQHQLPHHLQGPQTQGHTPQHTPRHPPVQPLHGQGGPPQFEGHAMQFSHSTSSVHPSPRPMPPYTFGTQPQMMPGFPQHAQMTPYGMSPVVPHAGLRQQGGPQFMSPPMPGMGGQMMTAQHSNGPYVGMPGNPQMAMYPTGPGPAYAHYPNQMAGPPGPNGFPSPRGAAPMMHHQGSQQGHQQPHAMYMPQSAVMFAQVPHGQMAPMRQHPYSQPHQPQHFPSPQQHHPYPQQAHRGTPSGAYAQPMMQQHSMPPQGPPPTGPAAAHGTEIKEEVK